MKDIRLIPGCENYFAGNEGVIYSNKVPGPSKKTPKLKQLKPSIQSSGKYYIVSVIINGKRKTHRVHRLVCMAFHGEPPFKGATVSHKDGNWKNNDKNNLEWLTMSDNHKMKRIHGTDDNGVKNSRRIIDIDTLKKIINLLANSDLTHKQIREKFGLKRVFISKIKNGNRYKGQGF